MSNKPTTTASQLIKIKTTLTSKLTTTKTFLIITNNPNHRSKSTPKNSQPTNPNQTPTIKLQTQTNKTNPKQTNKNTNTTQNNQATAKSVVQQSKHKNVQFSVLYQPQRTQIPHKQQPGNNQIHSTNHPNQVALNQNPKPKSNNIPKQSKRKNTITQNTLN